jgi:hypothetical protein
MMSDLDDPCAEVDRLIEEPGFSNDGPRIESLSGVNDCVRDRLEESLRTQDWDRFASYAEIASSHPTPASTVMICEALRDLHRDVDSDSLFYEEWLASDLVRLADPSTAPVLEQVLWSGRPAWDPALAKSCVDALCEIGTPESLDIVRRAAVLHTLEVRCHAMEEFDLGVGDDDVDTEFLAGVLSPRLGVDLYDGRFGRPALLVDAAVVDPLNSRWTSSLADLMVRVHAEVAELNPPLEVEVVFVVEDDRWPSPISDITVGVLSEGVHESTLVLGVPLPPVPPADPAEFLKSMLDAALRRARETLVERGVTRQPDQQLEVVARL